MMKILILIGTFVIALIFVLGSIVDLRIYFRTRMKGRFLTGVGLIVSTPGVVGITIWFINFDWCVGLNPWTDPFMLLSLLLLIIGAFLVAMGFTIQATKESGLWNEICEKTPISKRMIGSVPILKYDKVPPPFLSKRTGLILGISLMTAGILIIITIILFKFSFLRGLLIASSITSFISGLLFVIFSIVYLNKGQKSSE